MSDKTDARLALEARAEALGLEYPHNLGDKKLAERIAAAEAAAKTDAPPAISAPEGATGEPQSGAAPVAVPSPGDADKDTPPAREAGAKDTTSTAPAIPEGDLVTVTGPRQGRWRAGRRWTSEPVTMPLADLSDDEMAALQADPTLTVTIKANDTE